MSQAEPTHTGEERRARRGTVLSVLTETIRARRADAGVPSYTRQLLDGGAIRCAKKLGEEATEVVIAGVAQDEPALIAEAADLVYHLLVLLECRGSSIDPVLDELARRSGVSGLTEKALRGQV